MFCEQCGTKIGDNERLCQKCVNIQTVNQNKQKNKQLVISAIIGCSIIFITIILFPLIFGWGISFRSLLSIPVICGIIAILLNFICWKLNKILFALISGIFYSISIIGLVFNMFRFGYFQYFKHYPITSHLFYFFNILLIVSAVLCFTIYSKNKKL